MKIKKEKQKIFNLLTNHLIMIIGLIGKPSAGKSTFFKAATLAEVAIAPYPFTTIKANTGIAFIKVDCVDKELQTQCTPRFGYCINHKRFVPIQLLDVAGLVPDAHKGKGLGNQFLNDLIPADVLIHIVDVSGSTNEKGEIVEALSHDPTKDVKFLEYELDMWFLASMKKGWDKFANQVRQEKLEISKVLHKQLSGMKVKEEDIKEISKTFPQDVTKWTDEILFQLASALRKRAKPMIIAANKIDIPGAEKNFEKLKKEFPEHLIIPCSADAEVALKEAAKKELISYIPGESSFEITGNCSEKQKAALEFIKKNVLDKFHATGVQSILDTAIFKLLRYIAVFPGGVNNLKDSEGRTLPDVFLLEAGSNPIDFANKIHTDFAKNFIRAINVKTKQVIGKEYLLKDRDVIELVLKK